MFTVLMYCCLSQFNVSIGEPPEITYKVSIGQLPSISQEKVDDVIEKSKVKIIVYTRKNCQPCKTAKEVLSARKDLPFDIEWLGEEVEFPHPVPTFAWESPNGVMQFEGWYGVDHLVKEWTRTQTKFKPVQKQTNTYTPSWTWPGNLSQHLQGTHGVSTNGMTQDQMERTHDSLHEATHRGRR